MESAGHAPGPHRGIPRRPSGAYHIDSYCRLHRSAPADLTNAFPVVQLSLIGFLEVFMDIIIDTSALIAVIVGEPERNRIVEMATNNTLIGPGSVPWEIGNAFSAMFKQNRLTLREAQKGLAIFQSIPIRYMEANFDNVLKLSKNANMYAYDAYFLDCAVRRKAPLLTLDLNLKMAARKINIEILEV